MVVAGGQVAGIVGVPGTGASRQHEVVSLEAELVGGDGRRGAAVGVADDGQVRVVAAAHGVDPGHVAGELLGTVGGRRHPVNQTRTLTVEPVGEREIVIIRSLDAPRELVFRAHTEPDLLRRWMGPRTWELTECDIDLRPGGAWRYVMHGPDEAAMVMQGVYREVSPPARLVSTESFSDDWTGGQTVNTTTFDEVDGVTTVTISVMYASRDARDGALATGMPRRWRRGLRRARRRTCWPAPNTSVAVAAPGRCRRVDASEGRAAALRRRCVRGQRASGSTPTARPAWPGNVAAVTVTAVENRLPPGRRARPATLPWRRPGSARRTTRGTQ